jgi:hypothetical protein
MALRSGVGIAMLCFAATLMYFSHPRSDPDFWCKLLLAFFSMVLFTGLSELQTFDLFRYYQHWHDRSSTIVVQVRCQNE